MRRIQPGREGGLQINHKLLTCGGGGVRGWCCFLFRFLSPNRKLMDFFFAFLSLVYPRRNLALRGKVIRFWSIFLGTWTQCVPEGEAVYSFGSARTNQINIKMKYWTKVVTTKRFNFFVPSDPFWSEFIGNLILTRIWAAIKLNHFLSTAKWL